MRSCRNAIYYYAIGLFALLVAALLACAPAGAMAWKPIEAQYSNPYDETVSVTIRNVEGGAGADDRIEQNSPLFCANSAQSGEF